MRDDEPGDEAREKADPGRKKHGYRGHATPKQDEPDGHAGTAYNDAEDGEEPS